MTADAASAILLAAVEGIDLSSEELHFFESEGPAGITLFKRNIPSSFSQLRQNSSLLQDILGQETPAIIAIDQEGGRVRRLVEPFPNLGPCQSLGMGKSSTEELNLLTNYGFVVGSSLLALGINVNFAPVCDINTNPKNIAIGDRAFGDNPEDVFMRAGAFLHGMQDSGVLGCLKHFPGQGDAGHDTHLSGTEISLPLSILENREFVPFQKLLTRSSMVMISHAIYSAIDPVNPASLSSKVMQGLLRGEMGFGGVIVTDDMNMKALPQDDKAWVDSICSAVEAGADLVLVCRGLDKCKIALEGIRERALKSPEFNNRLLNAAERVNQLRGSLRT